MPSMMPSAPAMPTWSAADIDAAYVEMLRAVLDQGHIVETYPTGAPERARRSIEMLNYTVTLAHPRARLLRNPARRFNAIEAVARLVWNLQANNRLEDIAFYQPKVRGYSDDHLSVPGSNYGMRLFDPRPGINQIAGAIATLQREVGSRRAATVIWSPEDAVRESHDIPCAFGMFFHLRDGCLHTTTIMRSNNATLLLPYNLFEFTLFSELIAASVGAELGPYVHFAASMHIYDTDRAQAEAAIAAYDQQGSQWPCVAMPPMPSDVPSLAAANTLAQLEAQLRHEYALVDPQALIARGEQLPPYWRAFYDVLLAYALRRADRGDAVRTVVERLPDYFRHSVEERLWAS
jgi:thymidylate synthase